MRAVGARSSVSGVAEELLPARVSYFQGAERQRGRSGLRTCSRVRYPQVKEGVDLAFYSRAQGLEYDLILAPHSATDKLALALDGADNARIDANGALELTVGTRIVRHHQPVAYQEVDGRRRPVRAEFRLAEATSPEVRVGFELGAYDPSRPLIVDPEVTFSSYLGGSGFDEGTGIGTDVQGNTYVAGVTTSLDFPQAGSPPPGTGAADIFVSKISPDGSTLLYSAYLGGDSNDIARGLTVHADGSVTVAGSTLSQNFPVAAAAQPSSGGGLDGFATRINSGGTALVYSTYLGGSGDDSATCAATDGVGADYLAGSTGSANFPTLNPLQPALAASTSADAFVVKLTAGGTRAYSTYFGGTGGELAAGIAANPAGRIWVVGYTESLDFPTHNPMQPSRTGNEGDGFVASFEPAGNSLVYSTYLGGSAGDNATAVAVDGDGNAYVAGGTESADFPDEDDSHVDVHSTRGTEDLGVLHGEFGGGEGDAFLVKLDALGRSLRYTFLFGGTDFDTANGVGVDALGRAYLVGFCASPDMALRYPLQPIYGGGERDVLLAGVNARGTAALFVTHLGGIAEERGRAITVRPDGELRLTGETSSQNYPSIHAFQPQLGGVTAFGGDAFVTAIGPNTPPPAPTLLKAGIESRRYLRLTWADQSDDELGFLVERTAANGSPEVIATPVADATSFTDTDVQAGVSYTYRVFARSLAGQSLASNTAPGLISAGARLAVTPKKPKFSTVAVGQSQRRLVKLRNTGRGPVNVIIEAPHAPFSLEGDTAMTLAPRQTVTVAVDFAPTAAGSFHSHLFVRSTDPRKPDTEIHLLGKAK
jgi:hypothetical protein